MKRNPSSVVGQPVVDSERLLAFSSLLRKDSREFEFVLYGRSMGLILPDGSRIRVRLVAADDQLRVGQVLTYISSDRVVAHRLVRSVKSGKEEYVITRGDATVCSDWPVRATSVLGIVTEFCASEIWQPVGPPPKRWFGFRWLAFLISSLVANVLIMSPSVAVWMAKRIIRIHGMLARVLGFLKRRAALTSRAGVIP